MVQLEPKPCRSVSTVCLDTERVIKMKSGGWIQCLAVNLRVCWPSDSVDKLDELPRRGPRLKQWGISQKSVLTQGLVQLRDRIDVPRHGWREKCMYILPKLSKRWCKCPGLSRMCLPARRSGECAAVELFCACAHHAKGTGNNEGQKDSKAIYCMIVSR